jgi:hypothetical protein
MTSSCGTWSRRRILIGRPVFMVLFLGGAIHVIPDHLAVGFNLHHDALDLVDPDRLGQGSAVIGEPGVDLGGFGLVGVDHHLEPPMVTRARRPPIPLLMVGQRVAAQPIDQGHQFGQQVVAVVRPDPLLQLVGVQGRRFADGGLGLLEVSLDLS